MKREKAKSLSANASKLSKAFGTNSQSNSVFHWQRALFETILFNTIKIS